MTPPTGPVFISLPGDILNNEAAIDMGEPTRVDPKLIKRLLESDADWVPVIAPVGVAEDGQTYNVNADTVAAAISNNASAVPGEGARPVG